MIFLFFLEALAVVYYIVPYPATRPEPRGSPVEPRSAVQGPLGVEGSLATPGLLALGRALDSYGRGERPRRAPLGQAEAG